jgi:glutamine synthetase
VPLASNLCEGLIFLRRERMNSLLTDHFAALSTRGKCLATYIWLGGSGGDLREATKVLSHRPSGPDEVPLWTCDGTATGQEDAVVYLKAVAVHPDPLRSAHQR